MTATTPVDIARTSGNLAYLHDLVSGILLLFLSIKSMSCRLSGTNVGAGASALFFRLPMDFRHLGAVGETLAVAGTPAR